MGDKDTTTLEMLPTPVLLRLPCNDVNAPSALGDTLASMTVVLGSPRPSGHAIARFS